MTTPSRLTEIADKWKTVKAIEGEFNVHDFNYLFAEAKKVERLEAVLRKIEVGNVMCDDDTPCCNCRYEIRQVCRDALSESM